MYYQIVGLKNLLLHLYITFFLPFTTATVNLCTRTHHYDHRTVVIKAKITNTHADEANKVFHHEQCSEFRCKEKL